MDIKKPEYVQNIINKFCVTIGMIPASYKHSLTYEEQIMAIGKYLEETVYPAINNNAEALSELQNLFIELKDYVDNYFSDLNVQEQVNNKIDAMAQDGSLAEIINLEIFSDIQNDIEELQGNIETINDNISTINDDIDTLEGNISTINDDIDTLEGNISTINDDIDTLEGNISTINDDIDTLENNVSLNTNNIFDINKKLKIAPYSICRGIAHRGISAEAPENTIPAIRKAGFYGAFGVEIDVQTTLDNEIILMHDLTVDRMTDGTGTVNGLTYSYIESLNIDSGENVGYYTSLKVPTLEEALNACRHYNLHAMLELKGTWSVPNLQKLVNTLKNYGLYDNCSIISFSTLYLEQIREFDKLIPLAILTSNEITETNINKAIELENCMISMSYNENVSISNTLHEMLINNNIKFGFWTVNEISIANNLINNNPRY